MERGKEIIARKISFPEDVLLDIPKLTIIGKERITIENHKGILTFDEFKIRVGSKLGIINIIGNNFEILYIGGYTIIISGVFKSIIYEGINL